jgi:hypothetical protein
MTTLREAAQFALDALHCPGDSELMERVEQKLREALAEPDHFPDAKKMVPVAHLYRDHNGELRLNCIKPVPHFAFPVYTAPQPKAEQEPVAWMYFDSDGDAIFGHPNGYRPDDAVPLYAAPQPKAEPNQLDDINVVDMAAPQPRRDDTALLRQALEALERTTPMGFNMESDKKFYAAINALRERLNLTKGS